MRLRFLWRRITLQSLRCGLRRVHLNRLVVDADPARGWNTFMLPRFLLRTVTLTTATFAFFFGKLNQLPSFSALEAAPTQFPTMLPCLFRCRIAFKLLGLRFRYRYFGNLIVNTDPTMWYAIPGFFLCRVTLTAASAAILLIGRNNLAVDAAPTARLAASVRFFG